MAPLAAVFVALAGVLHVYIFVLESAWWTRPKTWKRFGLTSQAEAETTRPLAYNQGFYNLFLAVGAVAGPVVLAVGAILGLFFYVGGSEQAGTALVLFSTASMVLAAVVLTTTGPGRLRSALTQGTLPLIGFILFLIP
jgi:putative membrane protein